MYSITGKYFCFKSCNITFSEHNLYRLRQRFNLSLSLSPY